METPIIPLEIRAKPDSISFARIPCELSLARLQSEIDRLVQNPELHTWMDHVNIRDCSGGWDVLPLRCQRQFLDSHPILQCFSLAGGEDWENLPILEYCPEIKTLFGQLHCPIKSARMMRLRAGAEIKPHRDYELGIDHGEARLHLPIRTCAGVTFVVNNKLIPMNAGELWYFNADQIHEVHNHGSEDRINLVIDCSANAWLVEQIMASMQRE